DGLLLAILFLAAFLRFYNISHSSLWMDEIWSIEIASGRGHQHDQLPTGLIRWDQVDLTRLTDAPGWTHVWSAAADYTYPPLYPLLLRAWMEIFGNSPTAIRFLSAIFSIATVAVFFDLCKQLHGRRIAFLAAAVMTLAGAQLDAAQEARCYAMLIFLAISAAAAIVRIEKLGPTPRRLVALFTFLLLGLLTHYLLAGVAVALIVYVLLRFDCKRRRRALAAILAAGVLFAALWGPSLLRQTRLLPGGTPAFLQESQPDRHLELTLRRVAGLTAEYLAGEPAADKIFAQQSSTDQLLTIFFLFLSIITLLAPIARLRRRKDFLLWALWTAGTVGLIAAADLFKSTTMSGYIRYTILASPCAYAILAAWDWPPRKILRDSLACIVIALLAMLTFQRLILPPQPKENWKQAAAQFDSVAGKNDLIVFFNQDPWVAPGIWYMSLHYYLPDSNRPWLLLQNAPDQTASSQIESRNSFWLVGVHTDATTQFLFPGWQIRRIISISSQTTICQLVKVSPAL
ncbi:MAG: glycosyltransferase family 39 protein, partial [Tepidisphaeraceae bacterium]